MAPGEPAAELIAERDRFRRTLLGDYEALLLAQEPREVLDVGAGRGVLVERLRARGVPAYGTDPSVEAVLPGVPVVRGDATQLPFADGAVAWASLRHVPHHLERPREALREVRRVARLGALVAEPWFDLALEEQRLGLRADRFLKRLDRRRGRFHADVLGEVELRELLPPGTRVEQVVRLACPSPWWDLPEELERSRGPRPWTPEELEEADALGSLVAAGRVTRNGTLVLRVRWDPT